MLPALLPPLPTATPPLVPACTHVHYTVPACRHTHVLSSLVHYLRLPPAPTLVVSSPSTLAPQLFFPSPWDCTPHLHHRCQLATPPPHHHPNITFPHMLTLVPSFYWCYLLWLHTCAALFWTVPVWFRIWFTDHTRLLHTVPPHPQGWLRGPTTMVYVRCLPPLHSLSGIATLCGPCLFAP